MGQRHPKFKYDYDKTMKWVELENICNSIRKDFPKELANHIKKHPEFVCNAPKEFTSDGFFMIELVRINPQVFLYVKNEKWARNSSMIYCLLNNTQPNAWGLIYENITPELQDNSEILGTIFQRYNYNFSETFLEFSVYLRNVPRIAKYAINKDGLLLRCLSNTHRNNSEICHFALASAPSAYKYFGDDIKKDPTFIVSIFKKYLAKYIVNHEVCHELGEIFNPNDYDMYACLLALLLNLPINPKYKNNAILASEVVLYCNNKLLLKDLANAYVTVEYVHTIHALFPLLNMESRISRMYGTGMFSDYIDYFIYLLDKGDKKIITKTHYDSQMNGYRTYTTDKPLPLHEQFKILYAYDLIYNLTSKMLPVVHDVHFNYVQIN